MAPRDHPGGPWEQQDGLEVVNNRFPVKCPEASWLREVGFMVFPLKVRFWSDFGSCLCHFVGTETARKIIFVSGLSAVYFSSISESTFRRLALPNRGFRMEVIAAVDFSWKSFLMNFGMAFDCFWSPWGPFF